MLQNGNLKIELEECDQLRFSYRDNQKTLE